MSIARLIDSGAPMIEGRSRLAGTAAGHVLVAWGRS